MAITLNFASAATRIVSTTDYRNVETHVLIWLCDFDHDGAFARERPATPDCFVRSFKRFHRNDSSIFHDDSLPNVESRDFFGDLPTQIDILFLAAG